MGDFAGRLAWRFKYLAVGRGPLMVCRGTAARSTLRPFALTHNLHKALRGSGDRRRSSPRGGEKRSSIEHPGLRDRAGYGARHSGVIP